MKHKNGLPGRIRKFGTMGLLLLSGSIHGWTQTTTSPAATPTDAMTDAVRELHAEMHELRTRVVELSAEARQERAEAAQRRKGVKPRSDPGRRGGARVRSHGAAQLQSDHQSCC